MMACREKLHTVQTYIPERERARANAGARARAVDYLQCPVARALTKCQMCI